MGCGTDENVMLPRLKPLLKYFFFPLIELKPICVIRIFLSGADESGNFLRKKLLLKPVYFTIFFR